MAGYYPIAAGSTGSSTTATEAWSKQVLMRFASASARDTALAAVKTAGMMTHQTDTNEQTWYDGSVWRGVRSSLATATGAAGTTSGTTELVVATCAGPAKGYASNIHATAILYFSQTVIGDQFYVFLKDAGTATAFAQWRPTAVPTNGITQITATLAGAFGRAAGVSGNITLSIQRSTGTGTASVVLDATLNRLDVMNFPV